MIIVMMVLIVEMMMMMMISEDCGRLCFSSQDATEFVSLHQKCHLLTFDPSFSIYYFAFCTFSPVLFTKCHHHHWLGFFRLQKNCILVTIFVKGIDTKKSIFGSSGKLVSVSHSLFTLPQYIIPPLLKFRPIFTKMFLLFPFYI